MIVVSVWVSVSCSRCVPAFTHTLLVLYMLAKIGIRLKMLQVIQDGHQSAFLKRQAPITQKYKRYIPAKKNKLALIRDLWGVKWPGQRERSPDYQK